MSDPAMCKNMLLPQTLHPRILTHLRRLPKLPSDSKSNAYQDVLRTRAVIISSPNQVGESIFRYFSMNPHFR